MNEEAVKEALDRLRAVRVDLQIILDRNREYQNRQEEMADLIEKLVGYFNANTRPTQGDFSYAQELVRTVRNVEDA